MTVVDFTYLAFARMPDVEYRRKALTSSSSLKYSLYSSLKYSLWTIAEAVLGQKNQQLE